MRITIAGSRTDSSARMTILLFDLFDVTRV
ncbi:hypothetical protein H4V95_002166 [Arthrobacter sp. CAN_C5]|nr:hypothetical protein [Arthrobacter sp. CAN_C5]